MKRKKYGELLQQIVTYRHSLKIMAVEIREALQKLKGEKAVQLRDMPIEVWKCKKNKGIL